MISLVLSFAWGASVTETFPTPFESVRIDADAFGAWLRTREVQEANRPVRTYDGRTVDHQARVLDLKMVGGDLQQCADSAIRLRAEWRRSRKEPVMFHATSGDPIAWDRWQGGERPYVVGNNLKWRPGTKGDWDAYLSAVFMWAGTRSLEAYDTRAVQRTPAPGDVLVKGGSPGHAVVLMDVATDSRGRIFVLVGEGYMPAQDFHIELGPEQGWWLWDDGVKLNHWDLRGKGVHREFIR